MCVCVIYDVFMVVCYMYDVLMTGMSPLLRDRLQVSQTLQLRGTCPAPGVLRATADRPRCSARLQGGLPPTGMVGGAPEEGEEEEDLANDLLATPVEGEWSKLHL